ncbi:MAG: hypothetical protein ACRC1K_23770 [Planctomycetia bacterium]
MDVRKVAAAASVLATAGSAKPKTLEDQEALGRAIFFCRQVIRRQVGGLVAASIRRAMERAGLAKRKGLKSHDLRSHIAAGRRTAND